jgi:integrase
MAIPSYTAEALRTRMVDLAGQPDSMLVFRTRNGTPLTTNNIRRRLRDVLQAAGITGVTPHSFRRTVATTIERAVGAGLAAQLLGHSQLTTGYRYVPHNLGRWPSDVMGDDTVDAQLRQMGATLDEHLPSLSRILTPRKCSRRSDATARTHGYEQRWIDDHRTELSR